MKKKILSIILCVALAAALCACSSGDTGNSGDNGALQNDASTNQNSTQEPEEAEEPETPSNAATVGDYYVEIKGAVVIEDYEGNPAIIVTYAWTNNSDDTTSPMTAVSCDAFQNGVGLETAFIMDDTVYDSGSSMTEVRPGTTIDVQAAFALSDTTSAVEVEVGEWLTFDDDPPVAYMEFDPSTL